MPAHCYGWVRDSLDRRDHRYGLSAARFSANPDLLPDEVDLRPNMPPVYDQGELQSCAGNAVSAALAYCRTMQGLPFFIPSRLMLYFGARLLENTVASDCGTQIRDVIKTAAATGACPEPEWPYDPAQFATAPSTAAYAAAGFDRSIGYRRVNQDMDHLRACLADGDPIVLGFCVYGSFESDAVAANGVMPMPGTAEQPEGYHAVLAAGYNHPNRQLIVRNSWGDEWGDKGYFYMPYDYVLNADLTADFWTIRLVTEPDPAPTNNPGTPS